MNLEPCSSKSLCRATDDAKVLAYEVYQDDGAFDVHRNGPSIARWRAETAGMVTKVTVTVLIGIGPDKRCAIRSRFMPVTRLRRGQTFYGASFIAEPTLVGDSAS